MTETLINPLAEGILSLPVEVAFEVMLDLEQLANAEALEQVTADEQRASVQEIASECVLRLRSASPEPVENGIPLPASVVAGITSGLELAMKCEKLDAIARWARLAHDRFVQYA